MSKPKILVTSAGGKTGLPTAVQLLKKEYPVRAFLHRDDRRAQLLRESGAEIYIGNQYSLTDMRKAMKGVQRAYHCAPTAPNGLHFGNVFSIAVDENKLEHIVMLSQWLAHADHPSIYTREVWLNEQILKSLPETTLTINNTGWFADNYFMVLEPAAQLGILPMPLGDGDIKNNAAPSNEDIASINVGALINPDIHAGKSYRPTGPRLLSLNEIAEIFTKVLQRRVKYQEVTEKMFLKAMAALQPPGYNEGTLTQLALYAEEYRRGTFAINAPTNSVCNVAGRAAESFETITRRIVEQRRYITEANIVNRTRALRNFAKILLTPAPNTKAIERQRDHVLLNSPSYSLDSKDWLSKHDPSFGHVS